MSSVNSGIPTPIPTPTPTPIFQLLESEDGLSDAEEFGQVVLLFRQRISVSVVCHRTSTQGAKTNPAVAVRSWFTDCSVIIVAVVLLPVDTVVVEDKEGTEVLKVVMVGGETHTVPERIELTYERHGRFTFPSSYEYPLVRQISKWHARCLVFWGI